MASILDQFGLRDRRNLYIALTLPIVGIAVARWAKLLFFTNRGPSGTKIIRSPRKALQLLKGKDLDELPYPPDALPGGRDVDTAYGNIRVYEWGPESGRKVLCIHGISTPCIAFAGLAQLLVDRGCRVMLFDLFGRGYSDTPDPDIYRQDMGLWTSQILLALASSRLSWTGTDRFTLVGYSLGGGISASFTATHPELVESLVLIASGGLLRPTHISRSSKLLYSNLLPSSVVKYFVGRRLRGDDSKPTGAQDDDDQLRETPTDPASIAESEIPDHPAHARDSDAPLLPDRSRLSIANAVSWQVDAHPGFLSSFISSIKYAPVSHEHAQWTLIGQRCNARRTTSNDDRLPGLNENKVLIIFGAQDQVIIADEAEEDATAVLGKENMKVLRLEGAHDVPVVNARGCADAIWDFWNDSPV